MVMYNLLEIFFHVGNIFALFILVMSYILLIIAKSRKSISPTARIVFPDFYDQAAYIRHCYWSATLFLVISWLLCSSNAISPEGIPTASFSNGFLLYACIWAGMIFVSVIVGMILNSIKASVAATYTVKDSIVTNIVYSIIYFLLAFMTM